MSVFRDKICGCSLYSSVAYTPENKGYRTKSLFGINRIFKMGYQYTSLGFVLTTTIAISSLSTVFPRLIDPVFGFFEEGWTPGLLFGHGPLFEHGALYFHRHIAGNGGFLTRHIIELLYYYDVLKIHHFQQCADENIVDRAQIMKLEKALATTKIVVAQPKIASFFDPPRAFLVRMRKAMNSNNRPGLLFGHGLLFFREASRRVYYLSMVYYSSMVH